MHMVGVVGHMAGVHMVAVHMVGAYMVGVHMVAAAEHIAVVVLLAH